MATPLWPTFDYMPHQLYGIQWLSEREKGDIKGGILCDEMGLGKTIQMLGLIKNAPKSQTLLIAPIAVLDQWKTVAEKSSIKCFLLEKSKWILHTKLFPNASSLYLCGYEMAQKNLTAVKIMEFDRLICDEAHRLSNPKTSCFKTVKRINAPSTWFLTATPIVNSMKDLSSLFTLLNIDDEIEETLIQKYVLARSMDDLRSSINNAPLPPILIKHELDFLSDEEAELYRGIQEPILNQLRYGQITGLFRLALMLRLRQLSIHPNVYIQMKRKQNNPVEGYGGTSCKFVKIEELITAENFENHKWIIFCHFHEEMEMLKKLLSSLEFVRTVGIYSGRLSQDERSKMLETAKMPFNDEKTTDVLLIQLQSGGVGLNLQEFDRIIFSGPWWTQAMMNQAIGRAVRIGQKNQVIVNHLLLKEDKTMNIDRLMNMKAESKGQMNEMVLLTANRNIVIH
jgi:SNF2 family DNA or RNA helicase